MKECGQTDKQSVYEHGISVRDYTFDLLNHLRNDSELKFEWKLPDWVYDHKDFLLNNLYSDETIKLYTEMHDCGKPFCITFDEEGKRHFPNHAEVSYKVFKSVFDDDDSAELIKRDMDFHLLKADGLEEFANSPYAVTLMLVGLAELHSNAAMFGGHDSVSFKIKWKHTNKRGRQVINLIKNKTK
jgi:hypothetical protein